MFHTFGKVYLEDVRIFNNGQSDNQNQFVIYDNDEHRIREAYLNRTEYLEKTSQTLTEFWINLAATNQKLTIYLDFKTLLVMQIEFWKNILKFNSEDNLYWLHQNQIKDIRIKSTSESHTLESLTLVKSYRALNKEEFQKLYESCVLEINFGSSLNKVGIEYLLGTYFYDKELPHTDAFFRRINHLSWKQIVQEFFVIRNQLVNALYNNINLALPKGHKIDYSEDVEVQMYGNPYLSWMHDFDFREDNTHYIRENYDINIFAELYDNWIKYRRPKERTPELELELDNLNWITNAIKEGNWKLLFDKNLERDFGCIYVDNWLIHKGNQIWTGMLYREANHSNEKTICKKFVLI